MTTPAGEPLTRGRSVRFAERMPEAVRLVLLAAAWLVALGAALAPIVYLLRRMGVG